MLKRTFVCRDVGLWKQLYVALVRSHLEFASAAWNPYLKGDIEKLEKIQQRASKIPTEMRDLPYEERLRIWGLTTLEVRRQRGDLIQMYKAINGLEEFNWYTGPCFAPNTQTRSSTNNALKLERESFPSRLRNDYGHFVTVRHEFFLNRVCGSWNRLSNSELFTQSNIDKIPLSLNSFKARIDDKMNMAAIACKGSVG